MAQTTQDFLHGIDLTALTVVSGSQMNQSIDAAQPANNKGLTLVTFDIAEDTPDVPNPDLLYEGITPTQWKRYIWVRMPFAGSLKKIKLYAWRQDALVVGTDFLNWELIVDSAAISSALITINTSLATVQAAANAAKASADAASGLADSANDAATAAQTAADTANQLGASNSEAIVDLELRVQTLETPTTPLPIAKGGTGEGTLSGAVNGFGLGYTPRAQYFISEQYAQNVSAPNSVAGVFTKRQINTVTKAEQTSGNFILNGDFTIDLQAGRWAIDVSFPAGGAAAGYHKARLVKDSDNSLLVDGTTEYADTTIAATRSRVCGFITLTAFTKVKFMHITQNILSFGSAGNLGGNEVFACGVLQYLANT